TWTVEARDPDGRVLRVVGFRDKAASEALGRRVERLAVCAAMREPPDADPEKKGTTPATLLTGEEAGPDADAPSDAGEKNLQIPAELDAEAPSAPTPSETVQAPDPPGVLHRRCTEHF
ncbi:MAG: hypothetical protein WBD05_07935, partial [Phycisphaerae bacterium]